MKIFLDNCINHIAIQRMLPHWKVLGYKWSEDPNNCVVQLSCIKVYRKTDLPLVFRVDGVYYDRATDYRKRNEKLNVGHSTADAVIYQSNFGMRMCEKYLTPRKGYSGGRSLAYIIYNGIDWEWCGQHITDGLFNIIIAARWRRHKRLIEILKIFEMYKPLNPDARLHVIGDTSNNKIVHDPDIFYYGHLDYKQMKPIFAKGDVSIHLSKKDCCPNTVVESIGVGMPVITTTACGGAVELCKMTAGCALVTSKHEKESVESCYHYSDEYNTVHYDVETIIIKALHTMYRMDIRAIQPKELEAQYMANKYIKVMEEVLK